MASAEEKAVSISSHTAHPSHCQTEATIVGLMAIIVPVTKRFPVLIQAVRLDSHRETLNYRQNERHFRQNGRQLRQQLRQQLRTRPSGAVPASIRRLVCRDNGDNAGDLLDTGHTTTDDR
jgi:hypothetical protein